MQTASRKFLEINSWNDFFSYANTLSEKGKGDIFEHLTKLILTTKPEYRLILKNVWIQQEGIPKEIREKVNLPTSDEGIDIVAETFTGEFWAIQCKFKGQNQTPTYKELSTFGNLANNYCKNISLALLVHTGENGVRKRKLLGDNYSEIGLEFWLGLTIEDWERIHKQIKGQSVRPTPKIPRPHQEKAIKCATRHFIKNKARRGRLIMPCATGKSLTAFWIAHALDAKSVIIAVPSLALIKQSLEDWTREFVAHKEEPRPEWLVICSDESTAKLDKDEFVSDAHSMGIPTTTNVEVISSFLTDNHIGRKVIFTTYQSSDKLAQAARSCKFTFDLAILDEAHKTVGVKSKTFATLLSDKNISISKRIFMTATERVMRGSNDEVYSMDDEAIYGGLFHQLTFKEAIHSEPPIICDYKVLTITVTNDEIKQLIAKNKLLTDKGEKLEEQEAQSLASAIALRKATQKYGIKHAVSFHRSIKSADDFAKLNTILNSGNVDDVLLSSSHISSKKSAGERARLLNDFAHEQLALMTNARCLTEGVDVPVIDCVLFADPKQSIVDIVQASGRALRPFAGKECGYIMLPLIVPDGVYFDEFTDSTPFKAIARIISALSTQDEGIAEEFRHIAEGKQIVGGSKIIFEGNVPVGMNLDLSNFADKINAKIWERVAKLNWMPFFEARAFAHTLKFTSSNEWHSYCTSGEKPTNIPSAPSKIYHNKGWKSWSDWVGTNRSSTKENYLPFSEARTIVQKLNLKGKVEWDEYCMSGQKPRNIPARLYGHYSKDIGWLGIGDFLGTSNSRIHRSFEEARAFVHALKLKNHGEWRKYSQSGEKPNDIPATPEKTYKENWSGFGDWLGTGNIWTAIKNLRSFEEARSFVHELNLKDAVELKEYCDSGEKPFDITASPDKAYRKKGWSGMGDWLGTQINEPHINEYRQFKEARAFVHELKMKNAGEWKEYCDSGEKPNDIPATPEKTYKENWSGFGDWLGTGNIWTAIKNLRSFEEARAFVHELNLKDAVEWKEYCDSGEKPFDITASPDKAYRKKGWSGMGDWLGTQINEPHINEYRQFEEARAFVHELKMKNAGEWKEYCDSGEKPFDIPKAPFHVYKGKGWQNMGDWLGSNPIVIGNRTYLSFIQARDFVQNLNFKSRRRWKEYCKSNKRPSFIPSAPHLLYKDEGWLGMGDFLGTGNKTTTERKYRSFEEARSFVHTLGIKTYPEWRMFVKTKEMPKDIPNSPLHVYKNTGWRGCGDWLGTGSVYMGTKGNRKYLPFEEARTFVHTLNLQNKEDWWNYCQLENKPKNIPSQPQSYYRGKGWSNWEDWLGIKKD